MGNKDDLQCELMLNTLTILDFLCERATCSQSNIVRLKVTPVEFQLR
jgi:hypothetical protein